MVGGVCNPNIVTKNSKIQSNVKIKDLIAERKQGVFTSSLLGEDIMVRLLVLTVPA